MIRTRLIVVFLIATAVFTFPPVEARGSEFLRVGVYQNEPKVFMNEQGKAAGLWIDLLEHIAQKEGWQLSYVKGTWQECLDRLEKREIDIMVDVAYTAERVQKYDFNRENVLSNWAQIYRHESIDIENIEDLENKKVAALIGDISFERFKMFNIPCTYILCDSFREVFEAIDGNKADAGIISRLYGHNNENQYPVNRTSIIIAPVELHFAFPKGHGQKYASIIDRYLVSVKKDMNSFYHKTLDKWFNERIKRVIPGEVKVALWMALILTCLFAALSYFLRKTVLARNSELIKSEKLYRTHFENVSDVILSIDRDLNVLSISPSVERAMGYKPDEVVGRNLLDLNLLRPENLNSAVPALNRLFEGESIEPQINVFIVKDGTRRYGEVSCAPVFEDGQVVSAVCVARDVTDRIKSEERLAITQFSVDQANECICWIGPDGTFLYVNDAFCHLLGYSRDEMLAMSIFDVNPLYSKENWAGYWNEFQEKGSYAFESSYRTKEGLLTPVEIYGNFLTFGKKNLLISFSRDIRQRVVFEERLKRQYDRLAALRKIDMAITSTLDIRVTFNVFLEQVTANLDVDAACILLLNAHTYKLQHSASRGFQTNALRYTCLSLGEGYAGRIAGDMKSLYIPDLGKDPQGLLLKQSKLFKEENFVSYCGAPLIAKGHVKGVLEIFNRKPIEPDQDWMDFMEALAGQAAIAIDSALLFDDLQKSHVELVMAYDNTIEGWSRALDLRDKETEGHSQRVTDLTIGIARKIGMTDRELVHVRRGALLHDIGKMGIPDHILLKNGSLNEEEWKIMKKHPRYAYELLRPISYLKQAIDIPFCHHEKWDGTGYPRGLKGKEIPLEARIFAVVDIWDALSSDRPYRLAWPKEKIRAHIRDLSGKHLDPAIVNAFFEFLDENQQDLQTDSPFMG